MATVKPRKKEKRKRKKEKGSKRAQRRSDRLRKLDEQLLAAAERGKCRKIEKLLSKGSGAVKLAEARAPLRVCSELIRWPVAVWCVVVCAGALVNCTAGPPRSWTPLTTASARGLL